MVNGTPRPLRYIYYQAQNTSTHSRLEDIVDEFRTADIVALVGTQHRVKRGGESPDSIVTEKFWGIRWGVQEGAKCSNGSCGVTILFSKKVFEKKRM